jgi:hypothetical protein
MSQPKKTRQEILRIIDQIKFLDRSFRFLEKGDGFLIQMRYLEADVEHPEQGPVMQSTSKWYISPFMTESEIVETCWACVQRSQLHIAGEHFLYKGRRIYSQHFDIDGRLHLCKHGYMDGREPIQETKETKSNG